MKRNLLTTAFFALAAMMASASGVMTTQASAAESPMNDIEGYSQSALTFGTGQSTKFAIGLGYSRTIIDMAQATILGAFVTSGGTSQLAVLVGPTLDLPIDSTGIRNAIFLRLTGGIAWTNAGTGTTNFAYNLGVGKRFELFSIVSWDPEFNMSGTTQTNANPTFAFVPLALSFIF